MVSIKNSNENIICKLQNDNPKKIKSQITNVVDSSSTTKGIIRIATDNEAKEGELNNAAITPHTLHLATDTFIFEQNEAKSEWLINHNLNKFPSVTVVDSAGNEIISDVQYIDKNNCKITTKGSFKGKAYLN